MKRIVDLTAILLFIVCLCVAQTSLAGTISKSATAPAIDGEDIAQLLGATDIGGNEGHIWSDRPNQGQSFTTGGNPGGYILNAVTLQNLNNTTNGGDFRVQVGSIVGNRLLAVASETSGQVAYAPGDFITFAFDEPVSLAPNTLYGFDWDTTGAGFVTTNNLDNSSYAGGSAYSSPNNATPNYSLTFHDADRVFHADMTVGAPPTSDSLIAMNFGTNPRGLATADYTSTELGVTVTQWDHVGTGDWSGGDPGTGTPLVMYDNGAVISTYYDASNTWENATQPQDSPMRGYLDDGGPSSQPFVQIGGLSQWLANAGASQWRLTVLRSTDNTSGGFKDLEIRLGTPDSSWYRDALPVGDVTDTIAGVGGLSGPGAVETAVYEGSSDGFVLIDPDSGAGRGTIAGLIVESFNPEPLVSTPTISVNFSRDTDNPTPLAPSDIAGLVRAENWNNIQSDSQSGSSTTNDLLDNAGDPTSADITYFNRFWRDGVSTASPDQTMLSGYTNTANNANDVITVAELGSEFTSNGYDVIVYLGGSDSMGMNTAIEVGANIDGGTDQWVKVWRRNPVSETLTSTTFATEPEAQASSTESNYIVFTGLTSSSFDLNILKDPSSTANWSRASVKGIQITAIPEPSSLMLAVLAVLGLAVRRRH